MTDPGGLLGRLSIREFWFKSSVFLAVLILSLVHTGSSRAAASSPPCQQALWGLCWQGQRVPARPGSYKLQAAALLVLKHLQQAGPCNSRAALAKTVQKGAGPTWFNAAAAAFASAL